MPEEKVVRRRRGRGARERILAAAVRLFDARGINATGMEQVAAAAPVAKRTLYVHFPTKEDLVLAYLRHLEQAGHTLQSALDREDLPARERLFTIFSLLAGPTGAIRGCPFLDAAAEFPDPGSPVHAYARERKQYLVRRLAELAASAGAAAPESLAEQLAILSDGAASRAMVLTDPAPADHARALAEALLDQATGPRDPGN